MLHRFRSSVTASGRMNGMVNPPDALGDDPCAVTGIRAIDEPGEGLVELEITVGCNRASLWKDRPGEHPWFGQFRHRVRLGWNQGQMGLTQTGGSGSTSREVNLRTSSGLSGKQRGTPTLSTRLPWPATGNTPNARRRPGARRRPTRPDVPAWQKIGPHRRGTGRDRAVAWLWTGRAVACPIGRSETV